MFFSCYFDHEINYLNLMTSYRNLSLFSVCLHMLRCYRSCDKRAGYCKACSRVRDFPFCEGNAFSNLRVVFSHSEVFSLTSNHRIDLDVFFYMQNSILAVILKIMVIVLFFKLSNFHKIFLSLFSQL